jgi:hypothetical protein
MGPANAYFAEADPDPRAGGYIEKALAPPPDGGDPPPAKMIARGQPSPSSLALDGDNVYWATSLCDIRFTADGPQ